MGACKRGIAAFITLLLSCVIGPSLRAQTAQFVWEDSTTQGAWQSIYGADGYNIISGNNQYQNYPSYATVTPIGQTEYTWGSNISAPSALQEPGVQPPNNRIAAQWYSNTSLTLDINLTDGQVHQVAIYCLDYGDNNGRAQTVSVINPQNGNVLDSRSETSFTNGQYLIWNLSGHVQIQLLRLAAYNATVSGVFFDPPGKPSVLGLSQQAGQAGASVTVFGDNFGTTGTLTFNGKSATTSQWSNNAITATVPSGASSGPVVVSVAGKQSNNNNTFTILSGQTLQFLGKNGFTEGTWEGVYGSDGYNVIPLTPSYPSYATVTPSGQTAYTWNSNTSDVRALQVPGQNYRIAAAWCDDNCAADGQPNSFTVGINLTDGNVHQLAVYCLDWDNQSRVETVSILNAQGSVLDSHTVSSFGNGQYLVWNLSGNVTLQVTNVSGPNAVISGLFFGPAGTSIPTIWSISQNTGQVGTSVTVAGANFGTSGTLTFNGTAATPTQWTSNSVTAPVPTNATTGNIVVTAAGEASNGVPFTVTPSITSISPTSGPISTVVQINGTGFGSLQGSTAFVFNGITQTPGLWSSSQVTSQIPDGLSSGPVYIVIGGSNPAVFTLAGTGGISGTVTNSANGQAISGVAVNLYLDNILQTSTTSASNGGYSLSNVAPGTYSLTFSISGFSTASITTVPVNAGSSTTENIALSVPQITALTPSSGPANTTVTITGSGFGALQGSSAVTFGTIGASVTQWSNTTIVVSVPSGATTGPVTVTVGGASSNTATFTVGTGTIQGTVTAAGTGVTGATISALQLGVVRASTTSGSGGSYSLSNLAPGTYDMEVVASSYGTQTASGIAATAGSVTTQNFTLSTAGTISGTVTKSNGTTAISGATVNALQGYTVVGTATTNSSGAYSIPTLGAGTYSVTASSTGYDTTTKNGQAVTAGGTTTVNFSLAAEATISYAYDEAGRLAGVVDSLNNSVVYNYDAAGNIQSITRKAASALTISEFVPNTGPTGTTVTIYGSGFSSTPSQNTVTFTNNVNATVTSATPTSLVTTVPTGATTGTIKVTVGSSNATSTQSFTVTSSNGLPTITSFMPQIASPGTTVTIDGTNFDTQTSHDSLTVNVNRTYAATATNTALTTPLTGIVTSGHITVTTTIGSYTTTGYLFVPPAGYTATQVGYTGQVVLGGQVTATLSTANQIGLVAVDVPSGSGLTIATNSAFSSNVPYTIFDPYGNVIGSGNIGTGSSNIATTRRTTITGTCTIMIAPGNATGNVTLTPNAIPPDIYVPISVGGAPVTVATTAGGQSGHLTFSGYPGERIYLYAYNPTGTKDQNGNQGSSITMLDPAHNELLGCCGWGGGNPGSTWYGYSGLITLQAAGNYTINFTPNGLSTWGATFQVGSVPADLTAPITVSPAGGPPAPVTIATQSIAQSVHLTFSGSAGQRVFLYVYNPTGTKDQYGNQGSNITMLDSTTGNELLGCCGWGGGAPGSTWYGYSGLITLQSTGAYTINFSANGMSTWGATFSLVTIPVDVTQPITVSPAGGPPSPVTIATQYPGQSAHLTFQGSANQRLYLYVYSPTGVKDQYGNQGSNITMIDSTTGHELLGCCGWGGGAPGSTWYGYSGLITLQSTGAYTINFTANGMSTWGATFSLVTIPADVTQPITVSPAGGPPSPVTIATQYPGQSAHLTFQGSANQRLYLYAYNPTGTQDQYGNQGSSITMLDSTTGHELLGCCGWGGGAPGSTWYGYSGLITLQSNGGYTINFTPNQLSTWGATFSLVTIPADVTQPITVSPAGGPPSPVTIATQYPGQSAHLTFQGSANQQLYLYVYNPTGAKDQYGNQGSSITMLDSTTGRELLGCCGWGGGNPGSTWYGYSGLITLQSTGGYTINFTPNQLSTWGATFSLVTIPPPASNNIGLNSPVTLATSYVGQSGVLTFNNTVQNQQVYLYITTPTGTTDQYGNQGSTINMLDPSSHAVINNFGGGAPGSTWTYCSSQLTLSITGNYTINFTPNGMSLWGATFELMTSPCP